MCVCVCVCVRARARSLLCALLLRPHQTSTRTRNMRAHTPFSPAPLHRYMEALAAEASGRCEPDGHASAFMPAWRPALYAAASAARRASPDTYRDDAGAEVVAGAAAAEAAAEARAWAAAVRARGWTGE